MKDYIYLTNQQARIFLLKKHGLIGNHKFQGKDGILAFIRQVGCVQYDPIDICGKNGELVLLSRVKDFKKELLQELLYEDRALVDCFDKNLAILPIEDYPAFSRSRQWHQQFSWSKEDVDRVKEAVKAAIAEKGPLCSSELQKVCSEDLQMGDKVNWYWSSTKLSRAALEYLYFTGELAIHHKKGALKYYDLAQRCLPPEILAQPDPYPEDLEHLKWRVLRRIKAIGLLWNKASDGWLNIDGLKTAQRNEVFQGLLQQEQILCCQVEGLSEPLYASAEDRQLLEEVIGYTHGGKSGTAGNLPPARCQFIAPLDNLIWDRKLVKALFGFEYKWEIYTPQIQRKYGYYVLPILYGTEFVGRIEAVCNRKERLLEVKQIWFEPQVKRTKKLETAIEGAVIQLAQFNHIETGGIKWNNLKQ